MSVAEGRRQFFCSISNITLYCKQIKRRRKNDTEPIGACLLSTLLLISLYVWGRDLGRMYSLLCCGGGERGERGVSGGERGERGERVYVYVCVCVCDSLCVCGMCVECVSVECVCLSVCLSLSL